MVPKIAAALNERNSGSRMPRNDWHNPANQAGGGNRDHALAPPSSRSILAGSEKDVVRRLRGKSERRSGRKWRLFETRGTAKQSSERPKPRARREIRMRPRGQQKQRAWRKRAPCS